MNILMANWTWYPSGGDWTYIENLNHFYQAAGHKVIPFSMKDKRNFATPYERFFIENIDYKELNRNKSIGNALTTIRTTIWNKEARNKLRELLKEEKLDLAHFNNVHHYLTPASIVPELKQHGVKMVWTLHDYVILCPNTTFVSNDKVCEKCLGGSFRHCITNKCKKGSTAASAVAALEAYANGFFDPYKDIDHFICPSAFLRDKFIQAGFPPEKFSHVPNLFDFSTIDQAARGEAYRHDRRYVLYVGRIQTVKGVITLARAMKGQDADLLVVGDGEDVETLRQTIARFGLDNVKLMGKKPRTEVLAFMKGAEFSVVPSEWYENLPYSVVENLLLSKPVLGARIGGIPELVIDNETGRLFRSGDEADLSAKIMEMLAVPEKLREWGENARRHTMDMVSFERYGEALAPIFGRIGLTF